MPVLGNILVIDDDESIRLGCAQALTQEGYRVQPAEDGATGLRLAAEESFDLVLLDLKMPGISGIQVLEKLKEDSPDTVVVVITGYATIESAVEAMRKGAYDYLPKPFTPEMLSTTVKRAMDHRQLAMENMCLRMALREKLGPDNLIGNSPAMVEVAQLIRRVAPTDATVLIVGETGSGKELVARALHRWSHRREKPFVAVDCAALVESLVESELFGHVRGAFTGATETTVGKFEVANKGTVFFDEIGNVSAEIQAKLLRAIQEREIMKVGSSRRIQIDVRIIAATNNDLLSDVQSGAFREDLFYRLSVVPIRLPPLRERRQDIRLLAESFLKGVRTRCNRDVTGFSEEAMRALETYDWPGNVRELENSVERAVVMAESRVIQPDDLFFYGAVHPVPADHPKEGRLSQVENQEILGALNQFNWQMAKVADYLGINRKTLREKIRKYGISRP